MEAATGMARSPYTTAQQREGATPTLTSSGLSWLFQGSSLPFIGLGLAALALALALGVSNPRQCLITIDGAGAILQGCGEIQDLPAVINALHYAKGLSYPNIRNCEYGYHEHCEQVRSCEHASLDGP
ncbi:triple gene block protein 3 [Phaius virus X]|uniref:Movement protein TGBp3 n=1 Tax=Phaius virus X TaxID=457382 RepID=B0I2Z5_9VIRU|nr:triple gene block protein 3 [Phaius virus X]BAG06157.1 triple gene block protein 3 [Phaius virus X]